MVSFVHSDWKGHLHISLSELCFENTLGLLINNRSNFREERIIVRKIAATFREEWIIAWKFEVNHRAKRIIVQENCPDQNNRCHENAGKFRGNIVSSEISSKSLKKPGISSKLVCVTFAQYCSPCYNWLASTDNGMSWAKAWATWRKKNSSLFKSLVQYKASKLQQLNIV